MQWRRWRLRCQHLPQLHGRPGLPQWPLLQQPLPGGRRLLHAPRLPQQRSLRGRRVHSLCEQCAVRSRFSLLSRLLQDGQLLRELSVQQPHRLLCRQSVLRMRQQRPMRRRECVLRRRLPRGPMLCIERLPRWSDLRQQHVRALHLQCSMWTRRGVLQWGLRRRRLLYQLPVRQRWRVRRPQLHQLYR